MASKLRTNHGPRGSDAGDQLRVSGSKVGEHIGERSPAPRLARAVLAEIGAGYARTLMRIRGLGARPRAKPTVDDRSWTQPRRSGSPRLLRERRGVWKRDCDEVGQVQVRLGASAVVAPIRRPSHAAGTPLARSSEQAESEVVGRSGAAPNPREHPSPRVRPIRLGTSARLPSTTPAWATPSFVQLQVSHNDQRSGLGAGNGRTPLDLERVSRSPPAAPNARPLGSASPAPRTASRCRRAATSREERCLGLSVGSIPVARPREEVEKGEKRGSSPRPPVGVEEEASLPRGPWTRFAQARRSWNWPKYEYGGASDHVGNARNSTTNWVQPNRSRHLGVHTPKTSPAWCSPPAGTCTETERCGGSGRPNMWQTFWRCSVEDSASTFPDPQKRSIEESPRSSRVSGARSPRSDRR